jgi:small redox-active disulfide protein 2
MHVKVLGPGCANCERLEARTREALASLGLHATVDKVTDPVEIASYGVLHTPGLVMDEVLVVSGRVPTSDEIAELLAPTSRR